ncbi:MAG: hypothetical protein RBS37_03215 [Bacteroidales bacterium]|jgi:hypothetical protein|nr:hypothetical protein [Bacteroidales bacterium]
MNTKLISRSLLLLTVVLFCIIAVSGCQSGGGKADKGQTEIDLKKEDFQILDDIKQAEKIFNSLPSPLESAMLIKSAGARFDKTYLNPVENSSNYTTNKSMALNLGIYTCDLSFASLYDQTQIIINYMNAAKKMADGLGILDAINEETIEKLEENINNSDVIMEIVSETFLNSNAYLEDNDQPAIASIVLVGGWIEGLYIATQLVDMNEFEGNKLVSTIVDQKLSIGILFDLLKDNAGHPSIDELLGQLDGLRKVFDNINISSSPVRTEIDQQTNVTVLKSEVKTDMTRQTFEELKETVATIRNSFIK